MIKKTALVISAVLLFSVTSHAGDDEISDNEISDNEIIVTATRKPIDKNDYAGSVLPVDKNRIDLVAPVHPAEMLNEISGVNIHRNSGQEHLTAIRSPVLTGGAGAGSFLYLEDSVPLRAAGFANVNGLFESAIELAGKIEITKGPASVLYGSNAVHGMVNILSQPPVKDKEMYFDILANNIGFVRLKSSISGKALAGRYRISANLAHDNGFREKSGFDQQKLQIRHDMKTDGWDIKTLATLQNLNQETAGFIKGYKAYKDETISKTNPNPEAFRDGKSARIAVHFNRQVDDKTSLSLIPFARITDLSFRRHFVPGKALEDSGHKSIGLLGNYTRETGFGDYVLGLDLEYTNGYLHEYQNAPTVFSFIQGEHFDYNVKAISVSPYVKTNIELGQNTRINIGARADYTNYDYRNNIDNGRFGRFIRIADRQDDFFTITPKAGIIHYINQNLTGYARYARGSRAPQITDAYSLQLGQKAGEIKPEILDSFELGLKGKYGRIKFELAAYYMKKDNFFFRNADGFNVVNGKTKHKGIELDFNWDLTKAVSLSGAISLADHVYDFTDITRRASTSIIRGNKIDTAPDTLGFLQVNFSPMEELLISLKLQHVGEYFTDPGNSTKYAGHNVFGARGEYKISNRVSLYSKIDNLFDIRYADRADFAFGSYRYFPARPRSIFFGIKFNSH